MYLEFGLAVKVKIKRYECVKVTENMFNFLKAKVKLTEPELVMLMSLVGDMQICQVVDPMKTLRFNMPKKFLPPIVL